LLSWIIISIVLFYFRIWSIEVYMPQRSCVPIGLDCILINRRSRNSREQIKENWNGSCMNLEGCIRFRASAPLLAKFDSLKIYICFSRALKVGLSKWTSYGKSYSKDIHIVRTSATVRSYPTDRVLPTDSKNPSTQASPVRADG
jgi:hypothetical protein